MKTESVAKSIQMLKAVLDGKTYDAVARESRLSRSALEQRVKALARDVQRIVGVEDVDEDGSVREESVLRAQAAVNGYARPLFFASRKVIAAIDAYLEERVRKGQGTKAANGYRGLDAHSKLFLTHDGHAMPVRVRVVGDRQHHLCGVILDIYRKIFARAGLNGVSALC